MFLVERADNLNHNLCYISLLLCTTHTRIKRIIRIVIIYISLINAGLPKFVGNTNLLAVYTVSIFISMHKTRVKALNPQRHT